MIFDEKEQIAKYSGISPMFSRAAKVLLNEDFSSLKPGDYPVEKELHFMVQEPQLLHIEDTVWECHDRFIDIQFAYSGGPEFICYAPRGQLHGWEYNHDMDVAFSHSICSGLQLKLATGHFSVFFPNDAHRPCIGDANTYYRKIVFKIPIKL